MRRHFILRHFMGPSLLVAGLLASLASATLNAQIFSADVSSSEWMASKSAECAITHHIPGFGKAVFTHKAAGGETFYLEPTAKISFPTGVTIVENFPPVWRNDLVPQQIGKVSAVTGNQPIKLDSVVSRQLLAQLATGNRIVFTAQIAAAADSSRSSANNSTMRVVLEAKNFASAYESYQLCTGEYQAPLTGANQSASRNPKSSGNIPTDAERAASYIKRDAGEYGNNIAVQPSSSRQAAGLPFNSLDGVQTFVTDVASADWKSVASPFSCDLTHHISGFGKANLNRKGDGAEVFYIDAQEKIAFNSGLVKIETFPPVWRSDAIPVSLGDTTATASSRQLALTDAAQREQVIANLSKGTRIVFTASVGKRVTRVVLEAKNFSSAYKNYQQCIKQLISYTFAQVARTVINYPEKSEGLSAAAKAELVKAARYTLVDTKVLGLLVDAHSDNSGTAENNMAVAKQHAEWVMEYLAAQGVPATKITTRWHADKYPVADNKTAEGRARNRRVTIRMETSETRQEIERKIAEIKLAAERQEVKNQQEAAGASQANTENPVDKLVGKNGSASVNSSSDQSATAIIKTDATQAKMGEKTDTTTSSNASSSSRGKMTPEDIRKLVEGLDLIDS